MKKQDLKEAIKAVLLEDVAVPRIPTKYPSAAGECYKFESKVLYRDCEPGQFIELVRKCLKSYGNKNSGVVLKTNMNISLSDFETSVEEACNADKGFFYVFFQTKKKKIWQGGGGVERPALYGLELYIGNGNKNACAILIDFKDKYASDAPPFDVINDFYNNLHLKTKDNVRI